jgi:hypothetical protein
MSLDVWARAADLLDPPDDAPDPAQDAILATPVTLAEHLDRRYQTRPHLQCIAAALTRVEAGEIERLLINTPPQVGKSYTAVEWFAFWWLVKHPTARIVIGAYGDDLALRRGRAIRRHVQSHGARYKLYLETGSASMKDWSVTAGGGVRSVGVGAGIAGFDADLILVDDPHKNRAEAESPLHRKRIADWYSADLFSRRSPGCPVVLIQTPWHPDDLRAQVLATEGRIEDGGLWHVIVLPAFAKENDPLGRAPGEPLPHPKVPPGRTDLLVKHWTQIRAAVSGRDWASLWDCDPRPAEGTLLSWDVLRRQRCYTTNTCLPDVQIAAVAVDPSGGGRDTAGLCAGYLGADQRVYLTHDRSGVMPSDQWAREACILAAETDADRVVVEKNYGGDLVKLAIRTAWEALGREVAEHGQVWRRTVPGEPAGQERPGLEGRWLPVPGTLFERLPPRIVEVTAKKSKLLRAEPIAQQWIEDKVRTARLMPELEHEWTSWVPTSTDSPGRLDASVYLAYELLPVPQAGQSNMDGAAQLATATDLTRGVQPGSWGGLGLWGR